MSGNKYILEMQMARGIGILLKLFIQSFIELTLSNLDAKKPDRKKNIGIWKEYMKL